MDSENEEILIIPEKSEIFIPLDVAFQILARLDIENEADLLAASEVVGLNENDLKWLKGCGYYRNLKFNLLKRNHSLSELYFGGHKRRVKAYNVLVRRLILKSPERFSSLTAPYSTHKFLPESFSDSSTCEPAFYYPIDGQLYVFLSVLCSM